MFTVKCNATVYRQGKATECGSLIARADSIAEVMRRAGIRGKCDDETGNWTCESCQNVGWWKGRNGDIHEYLELKGEGR